MKPTALIPAIIGIGGAVVASIVGRPLFWPLIVATWVGIILSTTILILQERRAYR